MFTDLMFRVVFANGAVNQPIAGHYNAATKSNTWNHFSPLDLISAEENVSWVAMAIIASLFPRKLKRRFWVALRIPGA